MNGTHLIEEAQIVGSLPTFPTGFLWGTSTAAYQIEGAVKEDGRGLSIWDTFAHTPGHIRDGDTGDVACDHYHRWPQDLALLGELGVNAYRFSVAWPRIQPDGSGPANARGLDFYDRLVDALTERGISPVPTLFHWDLPQTLEDAGGWLSGSEFPDGAAYIRDGDLEIISTPIDALGINYYNPTRIGAPAADAALPFDMLPIEGVPVTAFGWPVVPTGLRDLLVGLRERYNAALPPIYITESGCSTVDVVDADGRIHDTARIDYLEGHLRALHQAIAEGVDVRGYFAWSLLDNFEWAEGYHQRFGLVRVDYDTLRRTPKDSFHWLRAALADQS